MVEGKIELQRRRLGFSEHRQLKSCQGGRSRAREEAAAERRGWKTCEGRRQGEGRVREEGGGGGGGREEEEEGRKRGGEEENSGG